MNSLSLFHPEVCRILLLTICLPKLPRALTRREGQRGGTNRLASARRGAHRGIHVGHFLVRARQLTS